ncbi:hypothetical protein PoB_004675900 [Plakobranchus ocellatus]|uniref:Uncharacterized protein n=1 Tax=Plakobranchus ocellatus TaxID=259542 RepID=A0AAV4BJG2_9GAST|nr:hypothetical protein PoB_004675900 [Plakobranchus ocellatus]
MGTEFLVSFHRHLGLAWAKKIELNCVRCLCVCVSVCVCDHEIDNTQSVTPQENLIVTDNNNKKDDDDDDDDHTQPATVLQQNARNKKRKYQKKKTRLTNIKIAKISVVCVCDYL